MSLIFGNLDSINIGKTMLNAAAPALLKGGQAATDFAAHEFTQYAEDLDHIQQMVTANTLTEAQGQYYVDRRKLSMNSVLLTIEGLALIDVQNAVNAALNALLGVVGGALNIK